jgi:ABC-type uncharacterized transport system permease subunit
MLPYLLTILVLLFISLRKGKGILLGAPAALGVPYRGKSGSKSRQRRRVSLVSFL